MPDTASPDVLIVGAGPTGLTAAAEAVRHGLSVRVIDRNGSRSAFSKALVIHSRSLEIFQDMGLAESVVNSGRKFHALNLHTSQKRLARIVFDELDWQDAIFPYWLSIPQSETERCLEEHLNDLGAAVERETELIDLEQFPEYVHVTLKHREGSIERLDVPWVVGSDGAHSRTRRLIGLAMTGKADDEVFILGDVRIDWDMAAGEGCNILSPDGILLIVPLPEPQHYRIIAHMPGLSVSDQPKVTLECLQQLVNGRTRLAMKLSGLTWSSVFSSKHFVISQHRQGRVFMAGDAAHIHSPVGGQGLNSGVQDAYNLMWKLALVHRGQALPGVLDSYSAERHKTAQSLIEKVGTATRIFTLKNPLAQNVRDRLAGMLLRTDFVRNRMGRGVAMLDITYRDSPIIEGHPANGSLKGQLLGRFGSLFSPGVPGFHQPPSAGMRAPNVLLSAEGGALQTSLFDLYRGSEHILMIFSGMNGSPDIDSLLELGDAVRNLYLAAIRPYVVVVGPPRGMDLRRHILVDADKSIHKHYAAAEPCLYLVRPDKHIAYRSQTIDRDRLISYLDRILVRKG